MECNWSWWLEWRKQELNWAYNNSFFFVTHTFEIVLDLLKSIKSSWKFLLQIVSGLTTLSAPPFFSDRLKPKKSKKIERVFFIHGDLESLRPREEEKKSEMDDSRKKNWTNRKIKFYILFSWIYKNPFIADKPK